MDLHLKVLLVVAIASPAAVRAAEGVETAEKKGRGPRIEARQELRERNPEAFRKMREELERRREEFKNLPPAEREAKMKEVRERLLERRKAMTAEERKAKRQEIKGRFEKQLGLLREKKTNGTLSAQEVRRLERLETVAKRFKQAESTPPAGK